MLIESSACFLSLISFINGSNLYFEFSPFVLNKNKVFSEIEEKINSFLFKNENVKLIEIDRTTYFRYENNQVKNIPIQNLLKLANILDIDLNKIKIK